MCQDKPNCGEFAGWPARALALLWVGLFGWALTVQWEASDPPLQPSSLEELLAQGFALEEWDGR